MAHLYGSWLKNNFDYSEVFQKIENLHCENYPKFQERVRSIDNLAKKFIQVITKKSDELNGKVFVNYAAILACTGRYFNDIVHYKVWHNIDVTNRAKMVAHTIKWFSVYPVIACNIVKEDYELLTKKSKRIILKINSLFISFVMKWIVNYFFNDANIGKDSFSGLEKKYRRVFYLLETGQYEAKTATLLFEEIFKCR